MCRLHEEPALEDGSSADEGVPDDAGWKGAGKPMKVGVSYTLRGVSAMGRRLRRVVGGLLIKDDYQKIQHGWMLPVFH